MDACFAAFRRCLPILPVLLMTALPVGPAHARPAGSYVGYTGVEWADDFGITRGRCSRDAVGKALAYSLACSRALTISTSQRRVKRSFCAVGAGMGVVSRLSSRYFSVPGFRLCLASSTKQPRR